MRLINPSLEFLGSYTSALQRGWSPNTTDPSESARELERIAADAAAFVAAQDDRNAEGDAITLPDGSSVPRLPGYRHWMWDGEFAGMISVRWQPGTAELPSYVLGHVGYSVVPWKRRRGYATAALAELLTQIPALGLPYLELTTDADNIASQKVITVNGGTLVEHFIKPAAYGTSSPALRWRIPTA